VIASLMLFVAQELGIAIHQLDPRLQEHMIEKCVHLLNSGVHAALVDL
jgi:hypothetical protein